MKPCPKCNTGVICETGDFNIGDKGKVYVDFNCLDCGTEWQKWTHAVLQANKIYKGDWVVDKETNDYGYDYVQQILQS